MPAGVVVGPAHAAGFFEQEGAGLGAVEAHAGVALGVAGAQGVEVVVVVVYGAEEGGVGGLGVEGSADGEEEQEGMPLDSFRNGQEGIP